MIGVLSIPLKRFAFWTSFFWTSLSSVPSISFKFWVCLQLQYYAIIQQKNKESIQNYLPSRPIVSSIAAIISLSNLIQLTISRGSMFMVGVGSILKRFAFWTSFFWISLSSVPSISFEFSVCLKFQYYAIIQQKKQRINLKLLPAIQTHGLIYISNHFIQ